MGKRKNKARAVQDVAAQASPKAAVSVFDSFSNPLFQLGWGSQSPLEATEYPLTRLTDNYALMNSLYRDNWLVQNVVELIPEECLKKGFELTGSLTPEQRREFDRLRRKTALTDRLREGLCWGRLYGGAAGLILIKGQYDRLSEPLDLAAVLPGSFEGLYILDRWLGVTPELGLTLEAGRPTPEFYSIDTQEGLRVAKVHHSRIIRFTGRELPALERYAELFWGASEVESLYKEVVAHDNVSANMAGLTFRANINTMEVANLEQLFGLGGAEAQRRFWRTMQAQAVMRSNFGTQLVNKGDRIENTQYTFTGLKDVFDSMCLNLCGCSHIPAAKLFGREPAGLNASGKSDLQNYYDYVEAQREAKLRPALEKLLPVLAMSCWGFVPTDIGVSFPPLWTPTAKELAEIAEKKAAAIRDCFQVGLLAADTAQRELKKLAGECGLFDCITDEEISANAGKSWQELNTLRDPLLGLE